MIWKNIISLEQLNLSCKDSMISALGIFFTEIGDDSLTAEMRVSVNNLQPFGYLHGGANCAIAETVGSAASSLMVDLSKKVVFGQTLNTNHLKAVKSGIIKAISTPQKISGSTHIWDIRTYDEEGDLTSTSTLVVAVRDKK